MPCRCTRSAEQQPARFHVAMANPELAALLVLMTDGRSQSLQLLKALPRKQVAALAQQVGGREVNDGGLGDRPYGYR